MEELEEIKLELIGKKLLKVFHTDQGKGIEHLEGLGNAYYFSTVLELENNLKYDFGNNWISKWTDSEPLYEVTHENWGINKNIEYNNVIISDLIIDDEDDIYIKLKNDVVIYHTIDYGDGLYFNQFSDLFNVKDESNKGVNTRNNSFNLWQRIKNKFNL